MLYVPHTHSNTFPFSLLLLFSPLYLFLVHIAVVAISPSKYIWVQSISGMPPVHKFYYLEQFLVEMRNLRD